MSQINKELLFLFEDNTLTIQFEACDNPEEQDEISKDISYVRRDGLRVKMIVKNLYKHAHSPYFAKKLTDFILETTYYRTNRPTFQPSFYGGNKKI